LADSEQKTWETTAVVKNDDGALTWYLSGTLPETTSKTFALALILEEDQPGLAREIGQSLLQSAQGN